MRLLIFLIITSLFMSNLANSAMLCCYEGSGTSATMEESPCHDMMTTEADNGQQNQHSCDCSASQTQLVFSLGFSVPPALSNTPSDFSPQLLSLTQDPLLFPPI